MADAVAPSSPARRMMWPFSSPKKSPAKSPAAAHQASPKVLATKLTQQSPPLSDGIKQRRNQAALLATEQNSCPAFGFAVGVEASRKSLSFSVYRDHLAPGETRPESTTVRCPCMACGAGNAASVPNSEIDASMPEGETRQVRVSITCVKCNAALSVAFTKRDPRLSI